MKINKVTVTGADNKVNYIDLLKLQEQYPFVEWGILFSKSKEGQQRYPTQEHIKKQFTGTLELSAHFCGWWSKEVLENQNFSLITGLPEQFKRVQLNYNFKNSKGWNLIDLLRFTEEHKERNIILQYNSSNKETLDIFQKYGLPDNIHFLYDGSGGRGTQIKTIDEPIGKSYTGYSGGLDVENIDSICETIDQVKNDSQVWIDMESGVRTNNDFDLEKVKIILDKCNFINKL